MTQVIFQGQIYEMPTVVMPLDLNEIIVPKCVGCNKVRNDYTCVAYLNPEAWFRNGKHCPLASHIKSPEQMAAEKKRVGQQKQKKVIA